VTMTASDIEQFQDYILHSFSRHGLPIDRCSQIIFSQLAHMPNYGWGINYPFQFVEREIMHLEGLGPTSTLPAAPFKRKLFGFMHKHFYVPGYEHLGVNARSAWKLDKPNSKTATQMVLRLAKQYKNSCQTTDELRKFSGEVANEFTKGLRDRLSGSATGNWIIYITHEVRNYYLCIAKHGEDEFILNTIKLCGAQFLFLNDVLAANSPRSNAGG
jgi:hypothetical protein